MDSARCFYQAIQIQPDYFEALYNLGLVLQESRQLAEACSSYEQALRLRPNSAVVLNNLGVAQKQLGRWSEAVTTHRRALLLEPDNLDFLNNLANALRAGEQVGEAIEVLERALKVKPDSAVLWHSLGNASREAGRLAQSLSAFRRALALVPDLVESHWDMAFVLLLQGDFLNGWEEYEWRWRRKDYPPRSFAQPAWRGEDLQGKRLLVYAEQGAGDAIQFARYLPLLAQRGARVILECPRLLVRLFETISGPEQVIAKGDEIPAFDLHCALLSLPRLFGTTLGSIPAEVPYLRSEAGEFQLPAPARAVSGRPVRVGLVWAGNPAHQNDARRSLPLETLHAWLGNVDAAFYSLQLERGLNAASQKQNASWLADLAPLLADYADTAALVTQLDLVISVDTSVAHLAGALGRPVWLLLPFAPEWRWLVDRPDSPWYPTMRLFRQPAAGDWNSVLKEVSERIKVLARTP